MTAIESVIVAGMVHIICRFAFYITPQSNFDTPGPMLPTFIVCVAILDVVYDNRIVPLTMDERPLVFKYIVECLVAIFILEATVLVFWQTMEHLVFLMARAVLLDMEFVTSDYYFENETTLIGAFTFPTSVIILVSTISITNRIPKIRARFNGRQMQVHLQLDRTVDFLSRSDRYRHNRFRKILNTYNKCSTDNESPAWVQYFENES